MKNLKDLSVTQIRIFPKDCIPYEYFFRPNNIDAIVEKYQFQKKEMPFPPYDEKTPNLLQLLSGEFTIGKQKILISFIIFENNKITIKVKGSSKQTEKVFSQIANDLNEIDPSNSFSASSYLIKTEETSCIVQLDINYESLFSSKVRKFLKESLSKKVLSLKPKVIKPIRLAFLIDFQHDNNLFEKHRITISPKVFIIEPRAGTDFYEKIFLTQSPTNSDTHLKIIEEFEKEFKG